MNKRGKLYSESQHPSLRGVYVSVCGVYFACGGTKDP